MSNALFMEIPILYQDQHIIAINKPHGLLVHRSKMDFHETESAVDYLREKLGQQIFTVHRLDKPTSGVLVFALSSEVAKELSEQFFLKSVKKEYTAIVRGVPADDVVIDHPLKEEKDELSDKKARKDTPPQEAITHVKLLAKVELPIQVDKYPTSRYALVRANPVTGRKHQIRRHLRHINHPIIGDINHGSGKHNRFFENEFKIRRLLLACTQMTFQHPKTGVQLNIKAPLSSDMQNIMIKLGWKDFI